MVELDIGKTTTADMSGVQDFSVSSAPLDKQDGKHYQYYPEAAKNFGYYKTIPELNTGLNSYATWTAGLGYKTENKNTQVILERLTGWGEDSFTSIMQNLIIVKKVVGDAFAEIIRNDKGTLINLKPISPERIRTEINPKGMIVGYEQLIKGKWIKIPKEQMLHLCNNRIGDETHGQSVMDKCKWVIDALHEVLEDHRKVIHRNLVPVRIIEVDTDNTTKIATFKTQYKEAIKKGEVLVIPKGAVAFKDNNIVVQDPASWINTLQNYFYIAIGIPRVIATSENYTEAGSKVGFLTFEPVYTNEQHLLESDLWNQVAIKVIFNRPPSLSGVIQEDEQKNAGQLGFQPNDTIAGVGE